MINKEQAKEILFNYLNHDKSITNKPNWKEKKLQIAEIEQSEAIIVTKVFFC